MGILHMPARLPETLVVHERHDRCTFMTPKLVEPFIRWSLGNACALWINTSGRLARNSCGPLGAHGYYRKDGPAIAAIIGFIR
jgi:hypothetical protein